MRLIQILLGVMAAGVVIFSFWSLGRDFSSRLAGNEATLTFFLGNDKRTFRGEVFDKMTILDALVASTQAGKIKVLYTLDSNNDTYIEEINGYQSISNTQIYLNSQKIDAQDLNKITIKPGDTIEIRTN